MSADPTIARALNDPLMIDPDLAWVNEANSAITYSSNHALPAFAADPYAATRARDGARIELREAGAIEELPAAGHLPDSESIESKSTMREILSVAGAPRECREGAKDDFVWAARMPESAAIMPHAMVQKAAGLESPQCNLRVIQYITQADAKDVLQYHYNKGLRAKLEMSYRVGISDQIKGERAGEKMFVYVSDALGGLRIITLVHWKN